MDLEIGEGTCEGTLPWGYLDPSGQVHTKIVIREMTGHEEEIFFSDKMDVRTRLLKIAAACTEDLGGIPKDKIKDAIPMLTPADFMYLLLLLRIASLGSKYVWDVKCEACKKEFKASIDLGTLDVLDVTSVGGQRNIREYPVDLASGRHTAKIKIPSMGEIIKRDSKADTKSKKQSADRMTDMLLPRVVELDGAPATRELLLKLPMRDRHSLRNWIKKAEVGIDDLIEVRCTDADCAAEFKTTLDVGQASFFFPEEDGSHGQKTSLL